MALFLRPLDRRFELSIVFWCLGASIFQEKLFPVLINKPLTFFALALTALILGACASYTAAPASLAKLPIPEACDSLVPAATGGPLTPTNSEVAVFRWLGNANYEINYKGRVYLLDTYFDRKARSRPLGFEAKDVKHADLILVGHAHFDHISDVGLVSTQTGAPVIGSALTIETAEKLGMPSSQGVTVTDGQHIKRAGLSVDVALARHSTIQSGLIEAYAHVYKVEVRADTPEEAAITHSVMDKGSNAPAIIDQGTMAWGLTLDNGFKMVVFSSAGEVTEGDRRLALLYHDADVAIVAYQPHAVAPRQVEETFPLIELFKPKLFLPAHHDASFGVWLDLGVEPLFEKLRTDLPQTAFLAPLYRSPICVATSGEDRGKVIHYRN